MPTVSIWEELLAIVSPIYKEREWKQNLAITAQFVQWIFVAEIYARFILSRVDFGYMKSVFLQEQAGSRQESIRSSQLPCFKLPN